MNTDKNNLKEIIKTTTVVPRKKRHFIKYVFWGILIVVITLAIIALSKIRKLQEENVKQKVMYESRLDSIHIADMTTMAKTFSWAVRSDLLRNNKDQAQLHLDNIIKESHVQKTYVIGADGNILLSSNRQEIGMPYVGFTVLDTKQATALNQEKNILLVVPVMDLNKKLGVSVIEISKNR